MPDIVTPAGLTWHYKVEGEGFPLLFIHGWGVNNRIWCQQTKFFSGRYKTIVVDLPGHGKTAWQKVTFEDIARDIVFILDELRLPKVGLIGSSLGGLVALKVFDVCPEKVALIVFVGSQPKFAKSEEYPYGLDVKRFRKLAEQLDTHYPNMLDVFFRSLFTQQERSTRRYRWIQIFRKTDVVPNKTALVELLDALEHQDLREAMEQVNVPVQFINGTEDYICPKELYYCLRETLPHARFDWFEECGHFPFLSKPYEFNEVMSDFFNQTVQEVTVDDSKNQ